MWTSEFRKEWVLVSRHWQTSLQVLAFYSLFMFASLFSIKDPRFLPPLLWLGTLVSLLLSAENFFEEELEGGVLPYHSLRPLPDLAHWILIKVIVRFILVMLPLLAVGALVATSLGLSSYILAITLGAQALAAPCLLLLAALGSSFSLLLSRSALLVALLILPLEIPLLILGNALSIAAEASQPVWPLFILLMGLSVLALSIFPLTIAVLVRLGVA
jgi:heme exporter protein B